MSSLEYLFIAALILYTAAIAWHKVKVKLSNKILFIFGTGLLCDILGTVFLCILHSEGWEWTFHSISGLAALIIMALHFAWALLAVSIKNKFEEPFNKYSVYAWLLWLSAFISGIPA